MKNKWNKLLVIAASALSLVAFQNCRIEIAATGLDAYPTPVPQGGLFSQIQYVYHVGFAPQPLFTTLTMQRQSDGSIVADLTTESCKTRSALSINDYNKIESMILNSPRRQLPKTQVADASTSYVVTSWKSGVSTLSEMLQLTQFADGIYLEHAVQIEQSLKTIADGIKRLNCSASLPTTSVRFQRLERAIQSLSPKMQALDVDLTVQFSNGNAYLSGHIATFNEVDQKVPSCRTEYRAQAIFLPLLTTVMVYPQPTYNAYADLLAAANKIRYTQAMVVCAMAQMIGPVQEIIPRSLTSTYSNGATAQGNFGCWHANQVSNFQDFTSLLDRYLQITDKCAVNPILARDPALPTTTGTVQ